MTKKNYYAWQVSIPNNVKSAQLKKKIQLALDYAVLAPSTHNSQPWQVHFSDGDTVTISFQSSSLLPAADPTTRDAYISIGCFVENCVLAAHNFGVDVKLYCNFTTQIKNSFVRLKFINNFFKASELESKLFWSIPNRVNTRLFFDPLKKLPNNLISQVINLSSQPINTNVFQTESQIDFLAKNTGMAVRQAQSKKDFRNEFAKIVKNNFTNSKTGMPAFSFGISNTISLIVPLIFKFFDISELLKKVNEKAMRQSSAIIILDSLEDKPNSWFQCGRTLGRQLLFFTSQGVCCSIHIALAEIEEFSRLIKSKLDIFGVPLMIYRVGYSKKVTRHTPRRQITI